MSYVQISWSPDDIERVMRDWERKHPGKTAHIDMTSKEFSDLMLADITARAEIINPPEKKN